MDENTTNAITLPVAAGSMDTIRTMIGTYRHLPKIHSDEAWDARQAHMDAIMNSIAAWGAQQRDAEKLKVEQSVVLAVDQAHQQAKDAKDLATKLRARAEKAEANYKIVCDKNDVLRAYAEAAQATEEKWQGKAEDVMARVQDLEAQLARRHAPLSPEAQRAIAAARAAGRGIAATLGGLVFLNDGTGPGEGELDCQACGGSGLAGDVVAGGAA